MKGQNNSPFSLDVLFSHFRQILGPACKHIGNGNRTEWNTIRFVIIRVINSGSAICFIITRMITDRIGLHSAQSCYQLIITIPQLICNI